VVNHCSDRIPSNCNRKNLQGDSKMKKILIVVLFLIIFVIPINATIAEISIGHGCVPGGTNYQDFNPNPGGEWICYAIVSTTHYGSYSADAGVKIKDGATIQYYHSSEGCGSQKNNPCGYGSWCYTYWVGCKKGSRLMNNETCTLWAGTGGGSTSGSCAQPVAKVIAYYGEDMYTISGDACGNGIIYLTDNSNNHLDEHNTTESHSYSFNIMNNTQYKIQFVDRTYEFTCTGNIVEDNSLCDYQILYYVDDCANLLKNPYIHIIKNDDWTNWLVSGGTSNTDVFIIPDEVQLNDKLDVYIDTDQGTQHRTIYVEEGEDTLYHSFKSWNLGVTVYDVNTTEYVSGAKVSVKQDCRINGYPCNTYGLTNSYGFVKTFDLSNQNYLVKVEKEGYNTFGYQTISANFDAQHTDYGLRVNLQDSTKGDGNGTVGDPYWRR